jgi:hypothetical protein
MVLVGWLTVALAAAAPALADGPARGGPAPAKPADNDIPLRYVESDGEWVHQAVTTYFHVYHKDSKRLVCQAARVAERTRAAMQQKWFGGRCHWQYRCEIYLHANSDDFCRDLGVPEATPGYSSFHRDEDGYLTRRIDLNCSDLNMLIAVLPHEVTHTVLAGRFGDRPVPRWADEGMAVLTEPADKIDRHLHTLPEHRNELFGLEQLMEMDQYPAHEYVGVFYAESVSLVRFLVQEKGARVFTRFLREGMEDGYESALRNHYGYRSFADLEDRWNQEVFGVAAAP